ncbi:cs domain-containing protein [Cyclospora cayetanensis]|uniref:Cs domain-containing protein n=1 Tax=Cyclospora cayetanensis TaxID=88456 RepID=A0A1D3CVC7_9EIME|nr:cs domain-containing protein [Cyclospora cayetanensis]
MRVFGGLLSSAAFSEKQANTQRSAPSNGVYLERGVHTGTDGCGEGVATAAAPHTVQLDRSKSGASTVTPGAVSPPFVAGVSAGESHAALWREAALGTPLAIAAAAAVVKYSRMQGKKSLLFVAAAVAVLVVFPCKGWWKLAQEIILESHAVGVDVGSSVRRVVMEIRNHLLEVERLLSKQHDAIAVMSPAFQWAESPLDIFLNIKFAYRWSSPGALSLEESSFSSDAQSFTFSGLAQHSGVKRQYRLELSLFKQIVPECLPEEEGIRRVGAPNCRHREDRQHERLAGHARKVSARATAPVALKAATRMQKDIDAFHAGNYTVPVDADVDESVQQEHHQAEHAGQKKDEL